MSDMDPLKKRPPKLLLLPVISTGKASRSSLALTPHAVNTHHDFLPRPDFPGRNRHLSSSVLPGLSALCRRAPSTFIPLVLCQSQQHSLGGPTTLLPPFVFMHRRTLSFLIYRLTPSLSFTPVLLSKKSGGRVALVAGLPGFRRVTGRWPLSANSFVSP